MMVRWDPRTRTTPVSSVGGLGKDLTAAGVRMLPTPPMCSIDRPAGLWRWLLGKGSPLTVLANDAHAIRSRLLAALGANAGALGSQPARDRRAGPMVDALDNALDPLGGSSDGVKVTATIGGHRSFAALRRLDGGSEECDITKRRFSCLPACKVLVHCTNCVVLVLRLSPRHTLVLLFSVSK